MSSIEQMYQQVIMDLAREQHGYGLVDATGASGESHQVNTTCGDEVRLRVGVEGGAIASLSWEGQGCSISQASVSALAELVDGKSLADTEEISEAFRALMGAQGKGLDDDREELLGDAAAFVGVGKYPARIKCALIGWMALKDALIQAQKEAA